jgi:hypothetical protein
MPDVRFLLLLLLLLLLVLLPLVLVLLLLLLLAVVACCCCAQQTPIDCAGTQTSKHVLLKSVNRELRLRGVVRSSACLGTSDN